MSKQLRKNQIVNKTRNISNKNLTENQTEVKNSEMKIFESNLQRLFQRLGILDFLHACFLVKVFRVINSGNGEYRLKDTETK